MLWAIALNEDSRSVDRFEDEWKFLDHFVNASQLQKPDPSISQPESTQSILVVATLLQLLSTNLGQKSDTEETIEAIQTANESSILPKTTDVEDAPQITSDFMTSDVQFINSLYAKRHQWVR